MIQSPTKVIEVFFFRSATGNEPVREWLSDLPREDRRRIGEDIKTVEFGWPLGMPLIRGLAGKANHGLWEVRTNLDNQRIARVIFCIKGQRMVLLHGFIKKSQKTPPKEIALARKRQRDLQSQELDDE